MLQCVPKEQITVQGLVSLSCSVLASVGQLQCNRESATWNYVCLFFIQFHNLCKKEKKIIQFRKTKPLYRSIIFPILVMTQKSDVGKEELAFSLRAKILVYTAGRTSVAARQ